VTPAQVLQYLGVPDDERDLARLEGNEWFAKVCAGMADVEYPADGDDDAHIAAFERFVAVAGPAPKPMRRTAPAVVTLHTDGRLN
jgi:hypothetical protein